MKKLRFADPPVVERVISLQFDPIPCSSAQMVEAWMREFKAEFPHPSDQPVLPSLIELFGLREPEPQRLLLSPSNQIRLWFQTDSGKDLLQAQKTRFIRNWRKQASDPDYQDFEYLIGQFHENALAWFKALGVEPTMNQVEVTYVNHVTAKGDEPVHDCPSWFFTFFDLPDQGRALGLKRENANAHLSYEITQGDEAIGRLFVKAEPAYLSDMTPIWILDLTARARPSGSSLGEAIESCKPLHDQIVSSFKELTTPTMHQQWGIL